MPNTSHGGHAAALSSLIPLTTVTTGQVVVPAGGGPAAFPDVAATYVRFKAPASNAGDAAIHGAGDADGWPLAGGEETGLSPVDNLNRYAYSGTDGDIIHYEVLSK